MRARLLKLMPGPNGAVKAATAIRVAVSHYIVRSDDDDQFLAQLAMPRASSSTADTSASESRRRLSAMTGVQTETGVLAGDERMLIDGELQITSSGATFDVIHPASEEVAGQATDGTVDGHGPRGRRGAPGVRRDRLVRATSSSATTA